MSEVEMTEKDARRLSAMEQTIRKDPRAAADMLNYAYGLGFCQGKEVTAKDFLKIINEHDAARDEGKT